MLYLARCMLLRADGALSVDANFMLPDT